MSRRPHHPPLSLTSPPPPPPPVRNATANIGNTNDTTVFHESNANTNDSEVLNLKKKSTKKEFLASQSHHHAVL